MSTTRNSKVGDDVRSTARERAVHFLYEAESRSLPVAQIVSGQVLVVDDLVLQLTTGVATRQIEIDEMIVEYSHTWTIQRMPAIDRNVLRLAIYELLDRQDVPVAVIINEAVELAKRFSTEESGRYVNGLLSAIAKKVRTKGV
ncbi:MAG: transcription antitermination factor NusB [Acidimicrobiaceae bacterium]|jgi:N utilization substance protein B|nr:transcription antitermination factor NusB [Ilumatobacteraceae bacterium]MCX6532406.1 transcription antitermination factor NusB [Actinomycetota bacterium]MDA2954895.1 transcription antitermination factor NusB [Actinomycetota bacterium]NQW33929.1 transcription antitermination factor NusB [Acidimicrobiaceae bacterium]